MYNEYDSLTSKNKKTHMGWHAVKISSLIFPPPQCYHHFHNGMMYMPLPQHFFQEKTRLIKPADLLLLQGSDLYVALVTKPPTSISQSNFAIMKGAGTKSLLYHITELKGISQRKHCRTLIGGLNKSCLWAPNEINFN